MTLRERFLAQAGIREATLVHYDIRESDARARRELSRFLTGRMEVRATKKGLKKHRYAGLLAKGGRRVGQSVLLLEPHHADELIHKLQELRVRYWEIGVYEDV